MRYRINKNFELKEIAGELLLLPRGASTVDYNYVTVFNETGAFIYRNMSEYVDIETLSELLAEKYSIDVEIAKADTEDYIKKMLEAEIIEVE